MLLTFGLTTRCRIYLLMPFYIFSDIKHWHITNPMSYEIRLCQFVQDDLAFLNGKVAVTTAFTVLHLLPSVLQAFNQPHHATFTRADCPAMSFVLVLLYLHRSYHRQFNTHHIHNQHQLSKGFPKVHNCMIDIFSVRSWPSHCTAT